MCVAGLGDFRFAHVEGRYDDTRECWVFGSQREFIFQVESQILQRLRWKEEEMNVWASGYLSVCIQWMQNRWKDFHEIWHWGALSTVFCRQVLSIFYIIVTTVTHVHQQMHTFIWNHKSPTHMNTSTCFSDKAPPSVWLQYTEIQY
jgi:hypothetical protein